jgi:spermidine synthase
MRRPPLTVLVFVVGMGSLGAEIAAVRLLAPYFGASTIIWANTIGVVLVALSLGYWLGGRWADRNPTTSGLCRLAVLASVGLAAVPFVGRPLLDVGTKALDDVSAGAFVGSLLAVLVLVAIPVLLLGAISPWALRIAMDSADKHEAGTIAGRRYATSTAGSLLGTLTAALLLIPLVGTRRTFLVFAFLIAATAVAGLSRRHALVPVAIAALIALPVGTLKSASDGRVVHEADTEYQYARVVEHDDGVRELELNEGQARHSVYDPKTVLTGDYWDEHLVLPFATGRTTPPKSVAILGNAGGTTARAYARYFPSARIDTVEIDPALNEIARKWFGLEERPQLHMHAADARPWLQNTDRSFDVIIVDAYRQPYIPFYLATKEFFDLARDRLNSGGVVIVNVGHPAGQDKLEKVLTATMRAAFPHVARDPSEPTNTQLVASDVPLRGLDPALRGGAVYTDDRAPVEWLIDKSILDYAEE